MDTGKRIKIMDAGLINRTLTETSNALNDNEKLVLEIVDALLCLVAGAVFGLFTFPLVSTTS